MQALGPAGRPGVVGSCGVSGAAVGHAYLIFSPDPGGAVEGARTMKATVAASLSAGIAALLASGWALALVVLILAALAAWAISSKERARNAALLLGRQLPPDDPPELE